MNPVANKPVLQDAKVVKFASGRDLLKDAAKGKKDSSGSKASEPIQEEIKSSTEGFSSSFEESGLSS